MSIKDAKDFFSQKIIQSANRENIVFDSSEKQMLYWSSKHEDMVLRKKFEEKHNDLDYEKKVKSLLKKACTYDYGHDPDAIEEYKKAYETLSNGDHYLLVMLNGSISGKINTFKNCPILIALKQVRFKDFLLLLREFFGMTEIDPQDRMGSLLRFFIGTISLALLYLPAMALIQHGLKDFANGSPNSNELKVFLLLGIITGFICIRGRISTVKLFFNRWW